MGLGIAARDGAPKLYLSVCGWICHGAPGCGFWVRSRLASSRAVVFMAGCGFGTQFLFQLRQIHGLGMTVPCGTGFCSRGPRAGRTLLLRSSPRIPSQR